MILFAGLLVIAAIAFSRPSASLSSAALVYLPLVFLLWSAVRFGVGVTGGALLALAYLTTWMATQASAPWARRDPAASFPALQFQLLAIAVPILCLCAVVQDRERGLERAWCQSASAASESRPDP